MPEASGEGALPPTPFFRLDGRRALVTGAGRGIGRAAAAALAAAGAHVVLVSRTLPELQALAAAIRETGGSAEPLVLFRPEAVIGLWGGAANRYRARLRYCLC